MKMRIRAVPLAAILASVVFFSIAPVAVALPAASVWHIPVSSAAISSVGYDPATRTLEVIFCRGQGWRYFEVPPSVYGDFLAAKSKGRFYNKFIKPRFKFMKLQAAADI